MYRCTPGLGQVILIMLLLVAVGMCLLVAVRKTMVQLACNCLHMPGLSQARIRIFRVQLLLACIRYSVLNARTCAVRWHPCGLLVHIAGWQVPTLSVVPVGCTLLVLPCKAPAFPQALLVVDYHCMLVKSHLHCPHLGCPKCMSNEVACPQNCPLPRTDAQPGDYPRQHGVQAQHQPSSATF